MKIIVGHSNRPRCGIYQYGRQLDRSLIKAGVDVISHHYGDTRALVSAVGQGDPVLLHFEPSIIGDKRAFIELLKTLRGKGARTFLGCHIYGPDVAKDYGSMIHSFVLHRTYFDAPANSTRIPLGCPTYEPRFSREEIRAKHNIPQDKIVLSTVGFLTGWKRLPTIIEKVLEKTGPDMFVSAQTPYPADAGPAGAAAEEASLKRIVAKFPGSIRSSTEFLAEDDLLDLAYASDLGFVYHPINTGSVSAATKQYVSARCPLVVTGSTHASDIVQGVKRVVGCDPDTFAEEVIKVASDSILREKLGKQIRSEYVRINMDVVAAKYVEAMQ